MVRSAVEGSTAGPVAAIGPGLLVLVGVRPADDAASAVRLLERVLRYRVFEDPAGKMNLSLLESPGRSSAGAAIHLGGGYP